MKKNTYQAVNAILVIFFLFLFRILHAQNVGIGTSIPDYRLHVVSSNSSLLKLENSSTLATGVTNDLFFKTGNYYTGAVKSIGIGFNVARLGFFTYSSGVPSGLLERVSILDNGIVGIGTSSPVHQLHVITSTASINAIHGVNNGSTDGFNWSPGNNFSGVHGEAASASTQFQAGVYGYQIGSGNNSGAVVGAYSASTWGGLGYTDGSGSTWGVYTPASLYSGGKAGIGTATPLYPLDVTGNLGVIGNFVNTSLVSILTDYIGVYGSCNGAPFNGIGVRGDGGYVGVYAAATVAGNGTRYGVEAYGLNGTGSNCGVQGTGTGGTNAYGIFGSAGGASTSNWAGYFNGNVFALGSYSSSDRKLKNDIRPLRGALSIINQLKPSVYTFKTNEYKQMNLPEGLQYGLIADEVQSILPGAVKKAVHPAEYENHDEHHGKKLSDEVEFNAVNYTEMIPILIGAVKEQQVVITSQQKKIDELEKRLAAIEKKL